MTEEEVTKAILKWLIENNWQIVCFDFPQSGTGRLLHPNNSSSKNKDAINPDIIAVKNNKSIFFENKDRFYFPDYEKIYTLKTSNEYSNAIEELLKEYDIENIFYGIGIPQNAHQKKSQSNTNMVDFIIGVKSNKEIKVLHQNNIEIFK